MKCSHLLTPMYPIHSQLEYSGYIKCKLDYKNNSLINSLSIDSISSTDQTLCSMLRKWANRHSTHLQRPFNLIYLVPFSFLLSLELKIKFINMTCTIHVLLASFISDHYQILHCITYIHCAFSHHCIFIDSVLYLRHPPWPTCTHCLGHNSSVTHTIKSPLIPLS